MGRERSPCEAVRPEYVECGMRTKYIVWDYCGAPGKQREQRELSGQCRRTLHWVITEYQTAEIQYHLTGESTAPITGVWTENYIRMSTVPKAKVGTDSSNKHRTQQG